MTDKVEQYVCMRCGNCCRWDGYVRLTEPDMDAIAQFLGLTPEQFRARYTRLTRDRKSLSLTEKPDGSCIFLEGNDCVIHAAKPKQCLGFPNRWHFGGFRQQCRARKKSETDSSSTTADTGEE